MGDLSVNPQITNVTAHRGSIFVVTLPNVTKSFHLSAQKATAFIRFNFKSFTIVSTHYVIPAGQTHSETNVNLTGQKLYVRVSGVATTPVQLLAYY